MIGQPAPPGLTLANYARFLGDPFYLGTLRATVGLGLWVTALAVALGYPVAYGLARGRHRWKTLLRLCVVAPLLVSVVIRTYGWIVLLANNGLVNQVLRALGLVEEPVRFMFTLTGVTIGLVLVGFDRTLEEAARGLGAGPWTTTRLVTLPLIKPGIVAGAIFAFILSFDNVVVSIFLATPRLVPLPIQIYNYVESSARPIIASVSTLQIAVIVGLLLAAERLVGFSRYYVGGKP